LDIEGLPAYIFTTQIEKEKGFEEIKKKANKKGKFYLLKPEYAGISYYQNRERIEGRLDLFISLYDKGIKGLFLAVRDLKPSLHFLAVEDNGNFDAKNGSPEVEEYLRAVCVQKYYPDIFWDYLICRAKDIKSTWWEDCLGKLDSSKIKACARGKEGQSLLKQNIGLNKELQVMFGPVFLTDNQEIFGIEGKATREELKKVLKK
ncbi:MAG: hypothetical protein KJ818_05240, partial [Candidatus Omnitrophica bacterium]|nr:hypothetical protein [Candidatus Omnitrophota bacterium]